jgi:hypothetical protein
MGTRIEPRSVHLFHCRERCARGTGGEAARERRCIRERLTDLVQPSLQLGFHARQTPRKAESARSSIRRKCSS